MKANSGEMKTQWQKEKQAIQEGVRNLKMRLEEARVEAEKAERSVDLQRAAELRYGRYRVLEKELGALEGEGDGPRSGLDGAQAPAGGESSSESAGAGSAEQPVPSSELPVSRGGGWTPTTWPRWWRAGRASP